MWQAPGAATELGPPSQRLPCAARQILFRSVARGKYYEGPQARATPVVKHKLVPTLVDLDVLRATVICESSAAD